MTVLFLLLGSIVLIMLLYAFAIYVLSNQEEPLTDEIYFVKTKDLWEVRLSRFRNQTSTHPFPILFVHGFSSNRHNFLFPKGYSMVDFLKNHGFDCWVMEMRGCPSSKPPFGKTYKDATIDDVLIHDLPAVIQFILQTTQSKKIFWIGHSLGGMLLYAYVIYHGKDHIANGVTLGAPLGFLKTKLNISEWAVGFNKLFPVFSTLILRMAIPFLKLFKLNNPLFPLNPYNLHNKITSLDLCKMISPPSPLMTHTIFTWYKSQNWQMLKGNLDVMKKINEIDIPLLLIYAILDPFVNIETAQDFYKSIKSTDKQILILSRENGCKHDYNHCDLVIGENVEQEVFIPIKNWLESHSKHYNP